MSIYGIGIDLVEIDRLENLILKHGDNFAKKILHPNELKIYQNKKNAQQYLATRFAAKEAFAKALGTGIRAGVTLPNIEIVNSDLGQPHIKLHNETKTLVHEQLISAIHVSISDEKYYATAQVVLEK